MKKLIIGVTFFLAPCFTNTVLAQECTKANINPAMENVNYYLDRMAKNVEEANAIAEQQKRRLQFENKLNRNMPAGVSSLTRETNDLVVDLFSNGKSEFELEMEYREKKRLANQYRRNTLEELYFVDRCVRNEPSWVKEFISDLEQLRNNYSTTDSY